MDPPAREGPGTRRLFPSCRHLSISDGRPGWAPIVICTVDQPWPDSGLRHCVVARRGRLAAVDGRDQYGFGGTPGSLFGDLVTHSLEKRARIRRERERLDEQLVGHPLVMDARCIYSLLDTHSEIDHIRDHLNDRADDAGSPRTAEDHEHAPVLEHDDRIHGTQRT